MTFLKNKMNLQNKILLLHKKMFCIPNILISFLVIQNVGLTFIGGVDAYGPSFVQVPPPLVLYSNNTGAVVNCVARGEPPPKIDWVDENGNPNLSGSNLLSLPNSVARRLHNGSLQFFPFRETDLDRLSGSQGSYGQLETRVRCRATNPYGKIVSQLIVIKPVMPDVLTVRVLAEPVLKYNTAVLRCQVPQSAASYTTIVSWTRGDAHLYPSPRGDGKFHVVPSGDLHVLRANLPADAATPYACRVRNTLTGREENSPPYNLIIDDSGIPTKPKELIHQDLYYSFERGQTAVLTCNVQSVPPPAFSWFRVRNNLLEPLSRSNRVHLTNGILIIDAVKASDSGQYRCTARNERGEASLTMNLDITSQVSLDIIPAEQVVDIGRQARMECIIETADGDDSGRHVITWMKDGQPLPNRTRIIISGRTLQIFVLQREDYGMYQCFVSAGGSGIGAGRNVAKIAAAAGYRQEAQASSELRLGDASPVMTYRFIDQTLQPGPPVSLKCSARGSPTPEIEWTLNGFPLPRSERFLIGQYVTVHGDVISHVNISRVAVEDGGVYICMVKNRAGRDQHSARLNIYGPPFVHPIPELKAVVGREFRVVCPASGYPIDKISWSKDRRTLPLDRRHHVFHNGTLLINKVARKDSGTYACTATGRQGVSSTQSGHLKVIVPPTLNAFTVDAHLRLGQRVSMLCSATDGDLPMQITWYRNDIPLSGSSGDHRRRGSAEGISITEIGDYESVLRIDNLRPEHNANFTCVAENDGGKAQHSQVLRVKVPPEWVTKPQDEEVVEGQDITLPCKVTGVPPPTVVWRKLADGGNIADETSSGTHHHSQHGPPGTKYLYVLELNHRRPVFGTGGRFRLLSNGSLVIRNVGETDEGNYLCEADNGVNEPLGKVVKLKVNAPPKFDEAHAGPVTCRTGETMELVCEASGNDHISVKWLKDGEDYLTLPGKSSTTEIREMERVTSKLRINQAKPPEDAGTYSCQASNAFGSSHFRIDVTIWEPPPTPQNLTILEISSRSVKIAWSLDRNASPGVERLVIQWKEQSEEWFPEGKQNILPGPISETIVPGLRPWTVYHLRLFAENQLGKSKEGKVLQFVTNGEKPGGSPRNVRITGISSTSLEVTWDDPERRLLHGPITRYNLGYREYSSQNYRFVDVDKWDNGEDGDGLPTYSTSSVFLVSRLRKFTKYEIVIQAVNQYGEGPLSRPSVGQTQEDVPDGPPEKVHCVALTSTTIQVSWHPPETHLRNGVIKGYKVFYAPHPGRFPGEHASNAAGHSNGLPKVARLTTVTTVLENLRKFSNYTLQVLSFTDAGDGQLSRIISCATHSDVPVPPERINVVIKSSHSVLVSWLPPKPSNGKVERYHIYLRRVYSYSVGGSGGVGHQRDKKYTRPSDVRWLVVDDLEPERQYQFWVTAVTNAGEGMRSDIVVQTPSKRIPARVSTIGRVIYVPQKTDLDLPCRVVGDPLPTRKWFKNGRQLTTDGAINHALSSSSIPTFGISNNDDYGGDLRLRSATRENHVEGNYTCYVENQAGSDSSTFQVSVQVPPQPAHLRIVSTTPDSITVQWESTDDGYSPITRALLNYKMTYGEWADTELAWHQTEHTLRDLHCGREYHLYVVLNNALGASPASKVITSRTLGNRPTGPTDVDKFVYANTTYISLILNAWDDHKCEILYFVVEYKLESTDSWTTVTNDLQPQARYSIRGLTPKTNYELKVTAHNHAGSTTIRYATATLPINYSGAAGHYGRGGGSGNGIHRIFSGLGIRSLILIVLSSLCLVFASIFVCVCLRKKHPPHTNGIGYGEIPKSCTMENGGNRSSTGSSSNGGGSNTSNTHLHHPTEHQIYATIQRKQPPFPPFGGGGPGTTGTGCTKGFDTIDRLKLFQKHANAGIIPDGSTDICPYATSNNHFHLHQPNNHVSSVTLLRRGQPNGASSGSSSGSSASHRLIPGGPGCSATLGRVKNLEMTEYQKEKLINEANTVKIKESKEYTLSLGRNHNKTGRGRKEEILYSESEEYDDTDTSGGETAAGNIATTIHQGNPPMPQSMHQNIFSTSSNIHPGRDRTSSTASSANVRMSHPPGINGAPLPQVRQGPLNNQQDPSKRQSGGRDGVVMGERSLLTNRITNFNNNPSANGGMMINNQQHRHAVNSALNNLNTTQFSNNTSSSLSQGVGGANNLLAANSTDYRQHLNL